MSLTAAILIGNTDNKLTQQEWSDFVGELRCFVNGVADCVHFAGHAPGESPYQNFCIVAEFNAMQSVQAHVRDELSKLRDRFRQDSIAVLVGATHIIGGAK